MISKPNNKVPNVHFVIHSNEKTTPIVELSLKYFDKYIGLDNINISVIANRFTQPNLPYSDMVNYITPNIPFNDGGYHFGPVLKNFIDSIQEEYFFYFCEDYMLIDDINIEQLNRLITLMKGENVDLFSFASNQPIVHNWKKHENNTQYGFEENEIFYTRKGFLYEYSVQPCLWRKSSFNVLLQYNPEVGLHHLDTSHIKGKKGTYRAIDFNGGDQIYVDWPEDEKYNFKVLCSRYMIMDYFPQAGERFCIKYIEIIRWGKITMPGTPGPNLANDNWVQQKIFGIVDENNLKNRPEYDRYFYKKP